ncbi:FHA domain-containing protein [Oscillochloris sp. ZM17-4]|uniref:FHA domain-containing protein n=1 Tax=Oscillochloris sp. ZM17-4 TaxID=2866714 RepID=UPI001C73BE77|nr:FHA domain-containing protein [Oscillochloris sp. ZM17-4]MBX0328905.1 FHA domain-containing protein [Oscillochloris sp. ZM17-4]
MSGSPDQLHFPTLFALHADVSPQEYVLRHASLTLGRDKQCQIVVSSQLISRVHARITADGPRFVLIDAGSVNGTYVNGLRLTEAHVLANDDTIGLGSRAPTLRYVDPDPTLPSHEGLHYNDTTMAFSLGAQVLELTPHQFRLLMHLYQSAGQVCSRESCAQVLWGREYEPGLDAAALDQAITSLRGALRRVDAHNAMIQTRRGVGYLLVL